MYKSGNPTAVGLGIQNFLRYLDFILHYSTFSQGYPECKLQKLCILFRTDVYLSSFSFTIKLGLIFGRLVNIQGFSFVFERAFFDLALQCPYASRTAMYRSFIYVIESHSWLSQTSSHSFSLQELESTRATWYVSTLYIFFCYI